MYTHKPYTLRDDPIIWHRRCVFSRTFVLNFLSFSYSMENILERYQRYSYAERAIMETDSESQVLYIISQLGNSFHIALHL